MSIADNIEEVNKIIKDGHSLLVAVSKTYSAESILEAYNVGQRIFGENKVQELVQKYEVLPKDIQWHLIGHLQTNKVKLIAPFVALIHSVDSLKLLNEINKEGAKNNRVIAILLQLYIADEETKFGFSFEEVEAILSSEVLELFDNIKIVGFMGMATNTDDQTKIRLEFHALKLFFDKCKSLYAVANVELQELSMGMSSDYKIAIEEGSTLVRIGSSIFGKRN